MRSRIASLLRVALGVVWAGLFVCHTAGGQAIAGRQVKDVKLLDLQRQPHGRDRRVSAQTREFCR